MTRMELLGTVALFACGCGATPAPGPSLRSPSKASPSPPSVPTPPPPVAKRVPSAESIAAARALVDSAVAAHGGLARLSGFRWFRWTGMLRNEFGTASLTRTITYPELMFIEIRGQSPTGHRYTSKTSLAGPRAFRRTESDQMQEARMAQLDDAAVAQLRRELRGQLEIVLVRAAASDAQLTLADSGDGCVVFTEASDETRTLCFDAQTHLLVRVVDEQTGERIEASKFHDVNGAVFAFHRVVTNARGEQTEVVLGDVRAEDKKPAGERAPSL